VLTRPIWRWCRRCSRACIPASLHPDEACRETTLLPALRQARIERLEGDSFVVVGLDQQGEYMREVDYPQAWACRVVT
jgi:hypothetical protein